MKYSVIISAAASLSLALSPAVAQQSSNGKQTREEARKNSQGPSNANKRGIQQSNEKSVLKGGQSGGNNGEKMRNKRGNSQGATNASDRARERANQNSAVQSGMMVHDKSGKMIGRVKEVRKSPTGVVIAIVVVLVVQINGSTTITLTPGSFQIVNNIIIALNISAPSGS